MTSKRILIGLHGKPRVGKDTVANHLIKKHNLLKYGPSVRVKDTTAVMFDIPRAYLDDDSMKDQMDPFWGITYRQMAQKVGKESSRDVFGDDIWMRHVEKQLQKLATSKVCVCKHSVDVHTITAPCDYYGCTKCDCSEYRPEPMVIPMQQVAIEKPPIGIVLADVRYANEIEWIKAHDGCVMYIIREDAPKTSDQGHVVDAGLPIELANYIVYNNTTIEKMLEQADGCLRYYFNR